MSILSHPSDPTSSPTPPTKHKTSSRLPNAYQAKKNLNFTFRNRHQYIMAGRSKHPSEWAQKFIEARAFIVFLCLSIFFFSHLCSLKGHTEKIACGESFSGGISLMAFDFVRAMFHCFLMNLRMLLNLKICWWLIRLSNDGEGGDCLGLW